LEVVKSLLEFYPCLVEGHESFLGSGDLIWYQIDVDGRLHACDKFMRGCLEGIVFSGIVHIFRYWEELCPSSGI
jgi:hypothetical protein